MEEKSTIKTFDKTNCHNYITTLLVAWLEGLFHHYQMFKGLKTGRIYKYVVHKQDMQGFEGFIS